MPQGSSGVPSKLDPKNRCEVTLVGRGLRTPKGQQEPLQLERFKPFGGRANATLWDSTVFHTVGQTAGDPRALKRRNRTQAPYRSLLTYRTSPRPTHRLDDSRDDRTEMRALQEPRATCRTRKQMTPSGGSVPFGGVTIWVVASVCLTVARPFSGFLALSTVFSPHGFADFFHSASTLRILGLQSFAPAAQPRVLIGPRVLSWCSGLSF